MNIAFFDIDNTVTKKFIIFPLAEDFYRKGIITKQTLDIILDDLRLLKKGKIEYLIFSERTLLNFVKGLKGQKYQLLLKKTCKFLKSSDIFYSYVSNLFLILKKNNFKIFLVTSESDFIGHAVCKVLKTDGCIGSKLEMRHGIYTGKLKLALVSPRDKELFCKKVLLKYKPKLVYSFGDSDADYRMLKLASKSFCINPNKKLKLIALKNKWFIVNVKNILYKVNSMIYVK